MKLSHKIIEGIVMISIVSLQAIYIPSAEAQIPAEYKPNYKFATQWNDIQDVFYKVKALKDNGQAVPTGLFAQLAKDFGIVFNFLPQTPENKGTYESCRVGAQQLSSQYDINTMSLFSNNCLNKLDTLMNEIQNSYTVKAKIVANPAAGAAPLTVTFDARGSSDEASKTTIPSDNYFWYFTDTDGVEQSMGRGPVVKYVFKKEGNYVIHLTVRSANAETQGIFDGKEDININVGPQAANLIVFVNSKKLNEDIPVKFASQEASDGLLIDGSASTPLGGRQIMKYQWQVTNSDGGVLYKNGGNGYPGSFKLKIAENGAYTISLTTSDNENNTIENISTILVADPIATIKVSPVDGTTSSIYSFDASTSYSVQSTLSSYSWSITDSDGNEVTKQKVKTFQQKFVKPGTYRVMLKVVDQLGNTNEDAITLQVGSTPPIPQFTMEPTKQRRLPSQFTLDASPSYDIDTANGNDALSYERTFSNNDNVSIEQSLDAGKRISVSFKEKGDYKATLTVKDNYGSVTQLTKDIAVQSALRPIIKLQPISAKLSTPMIFVAQTNKPVENYTWDFGDGTSRTVQTDHLTHTYSKIGNYIVKLTVATADGETNDVSTNAFVGEANSPIPGYVITDEKSNMLIPESTCSDENKSPQPAYSVDRYENLVIDATRSVNVKGGSENLLFYFKPEGGETAKRQQYSYKPNELGCHYVDFTVEDTNINKTASTRIWFTINNAKPTLQNVVMSFPQVGNTYGIGIGQTANKDISSTSTDKLAIKIDATNATDTDGSISKYKWYYYNTDDPNRWLEVKYTPNNIPYVYFSIDRIPGEYRFGVEVYDNDGASTKSEDLLGKGPVIFFTPDASNTPDIPIVTLKVDTTNAKVGDPVTLSVVARIVSERKDFEANRTISYDFDGDGTRDQTTKDDHVKYVYKTPGTYTPKVKVTYRQHVGMAIGETINVEKGVRADFLYAILGNTLIVRDTSYGDATSTKFCADMRICRSNPARLIENQTYFTKDYPTTGNYPVRYEVTDTGGNSSVTGSIITILGPQPVNSIGIVTIPAPNASGAVTIGNNLNNKVLFYVTYGSGDCFIDTDISVDSRGDGKPDMNRDISCNTDTLYEYKNPRAESTIARVYYEANGQLLTKDIPINFLDYNVQLSPDKAGTYKNINETIAYLKDSLPSIKTTLLSLRNALVQGDDTAPLVLQLKDEIEKNKANIDGMTLGQLNTIANSLADKTVVAAEGGNDYKQAKTSILSLIPSARKGEVAKLFEDLENANGDKQKIKKDLDQILLIGQDEQQKKNLDIVDIDQLTEEVCIIVNFYEIPGTSCKSTTTQTGSVVVSTNGSTASSSTLRTILKVIGIIAGIVGGGFIILVIVFALKAKKKEAPEAPIETDVNTQSVIPTPTPKPTTTPPAA